MQQFIQKPDMKLSVKQTFGFESDMQVNAFSKKNEYVPKIDTDYKFDKDTTLAILAKRALNGSAFVVLKSFHSSKAGNLPLLVYSNLGIPFFVRPTLTPLNKPSRGHEPLTTAFNNSHYTLNKP